MEIAKCPKCGAIAYARDLYSNGYYCFPNKGGCGTKFPVEIQIINGLHTHKIPVSTFLKNTTCGVFHNYYISKANGGSDFSKLIIGIKYYATDHIVNEVANIIHCDLKKILSFDFYKEKQVSVITVPRSKPDNFWKKSELQFRTAVRLGIQGIENIVDKTNSIVRIKETKTTHLSHLDIPENKGDEPYPGITKDTCEFKDNVNGEHVILIDDIYTECKGIDEDCIQFLQNQGAESVLLYTLGMTKNR